MAMLGFVLEYRVLAEYSLEILSSTRKFHCSIFVSSNTRTRTTGVLRLVGGVASGVGVGVGWRWGGGGGGGWGRG